MTVDDVAVVVATLAMVVVVLVIAGEAATKAAAKAAAFFRCRHAVVRDIGAAVLMVAVLMVVGATGTGTEIDTLT